MKKPPVLFIVFNRPRLTRQVFDAIRTSKPEVLYVACDGPRTSRGESESVRVSEVKSIVQQVDWPCKVSYKFSDSNLGCGKSVSQAIDWAFVNEDRLIILEDDCVPNQNFFGYCGELLERYKDDLRVGCIDGTSLLSALPKSEVPELTDSYYFSRIHCVWGWATWKRVWRNYSFDMPHWEKVKRLNLLKGFWATTRYHDHVVAHMDMIAGGRVDSWDYQLIVALALKNLLIAHPKLNLISNIGSGIDAHHNKFTTKLNNLKTQKQFSGLIHPSSITCQSKFDFLIEKFITHHWLFIKAKYVVFSALSQFSKLRSI